MGSRHLGTRVRKHTVQVISRHQQFQTQLKREVHIGHILRIFEFLIVIEVFADFLEHQAAANVLACSKVSQVLPHT